MVKSEFIASREKAPPSAIPPSDRVRLAAEREAQEWNAKISHLAERFEARWLHITLEQLDVDLAEALTDQKRRYAKAATTGTATEIREEGAALCRGYQVAGEALEAAQAADSAYLVGRCEQTGTVIAIGHSPASVARVRELYGEGAIWMSPDEVATMIALAPAGLQTLGRVKVVFPGANLTEVRSSGHRGYPNGDD